MVSAGNWEGKGAWKEGWQRAGRGWKGKWDKGCAPAQSSEPPSSAFLLTPSLPNAKGKNENLNTNHVGHIGHLWRKKQRNSLQCVLMPNQLLLFKHQSLSNELPCCRQSNNLISCFQVCNNQVQVV